MKLNYQALWRVLAGNTIVTFIYSGTTTVKARNQNANLGYHTCCDLNIFINEDKLDCAEVETDQQLLKINYLNESKTSLSSISSDEEFVSLSSP